MKTKGEIEAAVSDEISRFEQDYMGRGPKCIQVHLLDDLLVIRLRGVLAPAEENLVKSLPESGRDLLKRMRSNLIETTRPIMEPMVEKVTGVQVVTMHHSICIATGEEVILFALARSPESNGDPRAAPRSPEQEDSQTPNAICRKPRSLKV
jgi:uncharacterized protein YbcI